MTVFTRPISNGRLDITTAMSATAHPIPTPGEGRDFSQIRLTIFGRYMLEDKSEHPCRVIDMSPDSAVLIAEKHGQLGERVVAYLDHIGRVEGLITQLLDHGFTMAILASERKREKLTAQLNWLAKRDTLELPEDRRSERIVPPNPISSLRLPDGAKHDCRILDLSLTGAAIEIDIRPVIGSEVLLASMHGRVVRHFEEGIAIEFVSTPDSDSLLGALSQ